MRVDIAGEVPDSFHATEIVEPPATVAPAAGVVNLTSATAQQMMLANRQSDLRIMLI